MNARRTPSAPHASGHSGTGPATYEIRVAGHLDDHWSAALGDLTITHLSDGTTRLTGQVVDQALLHSVLTRIRDLGLSLLVVRRLQ
jgi:hypothetical protein